MDRAHTKRGQLRPHFFRQPPDLLIERTVAELQIVISDQLLNLVNSKGNTHGDADGAHRQEFDDPVHAHGAVWANPFERWQPHHLRSVKEKMPGTAFARINYELCDRLTEQLGNGLPAQFVSYIEGINIDDFTDVGFGWPA